MTGFQPTRRTTLASVGGAFLTRSSTPDAAEPVSGSAGRATVSVLDHIPSDLHAAIRRGRCGVDLARFFHAAATAANAGQARGDGPGGTVLVPAGTYPVSGVGIRNTAIVGEHRMASRIVAAPGTRPGTFLLDALLDRDGVSRNTAGGGQASHLVIDAAGSSASGLRTYGGGCTAQDLTIANASIGLAAGLPMWSTFTNIHAVDCDVGIHTFALERGDAGTSSTFLNCWTNRSRRYGFHITQLMYSSLINCAAQDSGDTNFFVEGDVNGAAALYSLQLIGCGTEGRGKPFRLRKCRDATLMGARVVSPPEAVDHITFEDSAGSIRDFSTVAPPRAPAVSVRLSNHGAPPGGVLIDGSIVSIDPRFRASFTLVGGSLNDTAGIHAPGLALSGAAGSATLQVEPGPRAAAMTVRTPERRMAAFPLSGGTILSAGGGGRDLLEALAGEEVAVTLTPDRKALRLAFKDSAGQVRVVDLPGRLLG
jgi:hypothetical protein